MHKLMFNPWPWRMTLGLALIVVSWAAFVPSLPSGLPPTNDKVGHLLAFLVLALLADRAWPQRVFGWWAALPLLAYGIAIECVQAFLPTRSFSYLDMLADAGGIALYAVFALLFHRTFQRQMASE